ncbi:MAG: hypothetical protein NVS9B1_16410 [Candidatus Dormibacteraceae bacterium]
MTPEPISEGPGVPREGIAPGEEGVREALQALADELGRVQPLAGGEQERLLAEVAVGADEAAEARLLELNLPLVLRLAHHRAGRGLSVLDLFQEGSVGLLAAIRAFGATGETDFLRFITGQIALAMEDAIGQEEEALRQERLLIDAAADYDRVEMQLAGELKRAPTVEEIGLRLEWTPARTEHIRGIVDEARRRHDEELLLYIDPSEIVGSDGPEDRNDLN